MRQQALARDADDRVCLRARLRHAQVPLGFASGASKTRNEILRQEWLLQGTNATCSNFASDNPACSPAKGPAKLSTRLRSNAKAERSRGRIGIPVGVDQDFFDLRLDALQDPGYQRPAFEQLQPFVDIAHAACQAAGENDARYWRRIGLRDDGRGARDKVIPTTYEWKCRCRGGTKLLRIGRLSPFTGMTAGYWTAGRITVLFASSRIAGRTPGSKPGAEK